MSKPAEKTVAVNSVAKTAEDKPPRVAPRLIAAPKIRQLYWCDFPKDGQLPEFWKNRAVLVISFRNTLMGAVTIIPCSGQEQDDNKWALRLPRSIDGKASWAICDKPTSLAVSRFTPQKGAIPRLTDEEFRPILSLTLKWLTPSGFEPS